MSRKPVSPKLEKFLEERRETELQHLKYLRETRAKYLEKRDRLAAGALNAGFDEPRSVGRTREVVYDAATDTYSIKDSGATIASYNFATGAAIYSVHGSAATYDLPTTVEPVTATDTTDATIKYLTLEEAMKLHREEEARRHYIVTREDATKWVKHGSASWMETGAPVRIEKNIRVAALSDGTYPEVGMRVVHDGVTFEIERIEIETPSWRPIAVGHAVGDTDTFTAGRLYVRAPLDELQPAKAKENVA